MIIEPWRIDGNYGPWRIQRPVQRLPELVITYSLSFDLPETRAIFPCLEDAPLRDVNESRLDRFIRIIVLNNLDQKALEILTRLKGRKNARGRVLKQWRRFVKSAESKSH